ncbi:MAG: hypothetical protein K2X81_29525, partial [Candidatus Obscuribacterales bacterium]|nr:hypothetical protein [Candidatus Obscuribacterales bacterium]
GTAISQLLAKGVASIPSYDSSRPKEREMAYQKLFGDWVKAVSGDENAVKRLEENVLVYDEAVKVSHDLARTASEVAPGVLLVDAANKPLYDPGTLHAQLEKNPSCRIHVLRKSLGTIAALHGIQYSLAVAKGYQSKINLHDLLSSDTKSDPEAGIISNVSFLLHTSEDVWHNMVLPRLRETERP